jgi:hypothetical protein
MHPYHRLREIERGLNARIGLLALSQYRAGSREEARATLGILLDHPDGACAALLGARMASEASDYEEALHPLEAAEASNPDFPSLGYNVALAEYHAARYTDCESKLPGHAPLSFCTKPSTSTLRAPKRTTSSGRWRSRAAGPRKPSMSCRRPRSSSPMPVRFISRLKGTSGVHTTRNRSGTT